MKASRVRLVLGALTVGPVFGLALASTALAPIEANAGCEGGCKPLGTPFAASMSVARFAHTATLLANGKVLVVGGDAKGGPPNSLSSSELFDPATNSWSAAAPLNLARSNHTATPVGGLRVLVVGGIDPNYHSTATAELYDEQTNTWSTAPSMSTRRYNHTATLLSNGNVVIIGGTQVGAQLSSVEMFNPGAGFWDQLPSLATGRSAHTATLLSDGRILVTGGIGQSGSTLTSAEIYDPTQRKWTAAASMNTPRAGHTAVLLTDGKVLVAGGTTGAGAPLASAELYDSKDNSWSYTGSMQVGRSGATATLLDSGMVAVIGGSTAPGAPEYEVYDPSQNSWVAGNAGPAHSNHTATELADGSILVAGGISGSASDPTAASERFVPSGIEFQEPPVTAGASPAPAPSAAASDGTWTSSSHMSTTRYGHTATLLNDGRVLVAGGSSAPVGALSDPPVASILSSAEVYDSSSNTWSTVSPMSTPRVRHTATILKDGRVLVAGGMGPSGPLTSSELFDPTTNTWSPGPPMTTARERHTATLLSDGRVLVTGGGPGVLTSAEVYDPSANTWTAVAAMHAGRANHTASLLKDGRVLVVGGGDALASSEVYDPQANSWQLGSSLSVGRTLHTATMLSSGKVLVAGGLGGGTWVGYLKVAALASTELYDPQANSWSVQGSLNAARYGQTATQLPNGEVVGICGGGNFGADAPSVEVFDPISGTWSAAAPGMQLSPDGHTTTLLPNGKLLIAGGETQQAALSSSEIFIPPAAPHHAPARAATFLPAGARLPIAIGLVLLLAVGTAAAIIVRRRRHFGL